MHALVHWSVNSWNAATPTYLRMYALTQHEVLHAFTIEYRSAGCACINWKLCIGGALHIATHSKHGHACACSLTHAFTIECVTDAIIYVYIYIYLLYGCGQHQREKCAYIKDNCTLFSMMSTATVLNHVLSPLAPR